MKKQIPLTLIALLLLHTVLLAQQNFTKPLDEKKRQGELTGIETMQNAQKNRTGILVSADGTMKTISACDCWIDHDSPWPAVPFDGSGGSGGPGVPPLYRNDDWSTDTIHLLSPFCFYGTYYHDLFINNNGNVSFGSAYATFTPDSFPNSNFVMIAPFWSDVDTRDSLSGVVHYQLTNSHLVVQWEEVGYYMNHSDLRNTYQLILSDGLDPILPQGYNVSFCYKDMQWTTGDASLGVGGFGGSPATVGANQGNGINFIQMGRFDTSGTGYDGPFGGFDGVDFLDNQSFIFNTCISSFNVAPILSSVTACDTVDICIGDTYVFTASFLSPEQGEITTPSVNLNGMTGASIDSLNPGNVAFIQVTVTGSVSNQGYHTIDLTGTDNGSPNQTTTVPMVINIVQPPVPGFTVSPVAGLEVSFNNITVGGESFSWDFGDGSPLSNAYDTSHVYPAPGNYTVTLIVTSPNACFVDTLSQVITVVNTGVSIIRMEDNLSLVPNPAGKSFRILGNTNVISRLEIINLSGQVIMAAGNLEPGKPVPIDKIPAGIYFCRIFDHQGMEVADRKLIIQR
ncbi:MAG: T9SS type A sorting domain-containing protein [Bacteroidia bacterium]|nr:T9SS type A sorting domain-containing protein [Bacteroidia bacterium]